MRRGIDPKGLADYLKSFLGRGSYRHAVMGQYFRGTIAAVSGSGPYLVSLIHTGETESDNGQHLCAVPDYGPCPGDDVLCVWVDPTHAVVLQSINGNKLRARAYRNAALSTAASAFTIIQCDTANWNYHNDLDLVTNKGRYTAPITGLYDVRGQAYPQSAGARGICSILVNGGEYARGNDQTIAANNGVWVGGTVLLSKGDYAEIAVFTTNVAVLNVGQSEWCWMEVNYRGF